MVIYKLLWSLVLKIYIFSLKIKGCFVFYLNYLKCINYYLILDFDFYFVYVYLVFVVIMLIILVLLYLFFFKDWVW